MTSLQKIDESIRDFYRLRAVFNGHVRNFHRLDVVVSSHIQYLQKDLVDLRAQNGAEIQALRVQGQHYYSVNQDLEKRVTDLEAFIRALKRT